LQAAERKVVLRIKDTVNLGAARLQQLCQLVLGDFLFLRCLGELPRNDLFDRLRLRLFEDASSLRKSSRLEPICFLLIAPTPSCASAPLPNRIRRGNKRQNFRLWF
jgi:hypothetical protein